MKRIHLFVLLLVVCSVLQAQDSLSVFKPSKGNKLVQIDIDFGANFDLAYRREGNMLAALTDKKAVIPAINFRLQHFFSQKWGWYASVRLVLPKKYERDCYGELVRAFESDYYVRNLVADEQVPSVSSCLDAGVVYRIENSRWAFYPRLGIGVSNVGNQEVFAELKKRGGNELYRVKYANGKEYGSKGMDILVFTAGLSVNYKLSPHCFLLLNANYTQPVGNNTCYEEVSNLYIKGKTERKDFKSSTLARDLNISVGVGLPIYSGRRSKKNGSTQKERMRKIMEQKRKSFGLFPGNK